MNRRAFEKHLRDHGCQFHHHGGNHDIWVNPTNMVRAPVPRHRTLKRGIVRTICRKFDIPLPPGI